MKRSKSAKNRYRAGVGFFSFSGALFILDGLYYGVYDIDLIFIGMFALCVFWILGIQHDLYGEK